MPIRQLPPETVNRIADGEVVEGRAEGVVGCAIEELALEVGDGLGGGRVGVGEDAGREEEPAGLHHAEPVLVDTNARVEGHRGARGYYRWRSAAPPLARAAGGDVYRRGRDRRRRQRGADRLRSRERVVVVLKSVEIKRYRGLRDLKLDDLGRVNLLVGANNGGKSSVLEAVVLALRPFDPGQWISTAMLRDATAPMVESIWGMFPTAQAFRETEVDDLKAEDIDVKILSDAGTRRLRVHATPTLELVTDPQGGYPFDAMSASVSVGVNLSTEGGGALAHSMVFRSRQQVPVGRDPGARRAFLLNPSSHRSTQQVVASLAAAVDGGYKARSVELLRSFDTEIQDVHLSSAFGRETIRIEHKTRGVVDVSTFGEGVRRALSLALSLPRAFEGAMLIDEVEASMHTRMLVRTMNWLKTHANGYNVQLFLTTHSLETVDALLEVFEGQADDALVTYHLSRGAGGHEVRRFDLPRLSRARSERGFDVR